MQIEVQKRQICRNRKLIEWLLRINGEGEWAVTANGYRVSFLDDENVEELDSGDGF